MTSEINSKNLIDIHRSAFNDLDFVHKSMGKTETEKSKLIQFDKENKTEKSVHSNIG